MNHTLIKEQKMKVIYRISDSGYNKIKPDYINNENCYKCLRVVTKVVLYALVVKKNLPWQVNPQHGPEGTSITSWFFIKTRLLKVCTRLLKV